MIQNLQRHLTFLFTIATGVILTLVLVVAFFYQSNQKLSQKNTFFQNQLLDLTHRLESTSSISDDLLAKLEEDGRLIIHIEDGGTPLFFSGSFCPSTERSLLISLAKKEAQKEGIHTTMKPYSSSLVKSSIFSLKGKHHDSYQATVLVISTEKGYRSLTLLADISNMHREFLLQIAFFILLEILGVCSLFLVSRYVVQKAMKPIEQYHQKQNEFLAAASHELRSPLAVMQTSAFTILSMPEQTQKMAHLIQQECIRAGNLIKNLLLLASENYSPKELQIVEIDLLLLKIFETYEPLCDSKKIKLKLKLPDEFLPKVFGNYQWIYQILSIFLDNAICYGCTKEKPVIKLSAELQAKRLLVSVTDYGLGIPEAEKSQIFDRFYRIDQSRNHKEHSGLGLSIAKTLADSMSLSIHVTDTPGGGSTFQVYFSI